MKFDLLNRYRFMAIVAGVMSLLLWFVYMPIKYVLHNEGLHSATIWIPMVHGYLYPIYVLFAIQFSVAKRWKTLNILGLILAGTLPIASIWAERYVVRKYGN
jgi:integral membrane protein